MGLEGPAPPALRSSPRAGPGRLCLQAEAQVHSEPVQAAASWAVGERREDGEAAGWSPWAAREGRGPEKRVKREPRSGMISEAAAWMQS